MVIVAKKIHPRSIIAGAAVAVFALALTVAGVELSCGSSPQPVSAIQQVDGRGVRTNEERVAYLTRLGWEVESEPASIEDVLIPKTFDPSYEEYVTLQTEQGFDLTPYGGKTVQRYTYQIHNFPGLQENVWATLLIYRHTVIGGEVYSPAGDGFMTGLAFPGQRQ